MSLEIKKIKNIIKNSLDNLGYVEDLRLNNIINTLYDKHPHYPLLADIISKSIASANFNISDHDAWTFTTLFIEGIKSGLISNNLYFQDTLKYGLQVSSSGKRKPNFVLINSQFYSYNNYSYVTLDNNIKSIDTFFDFVIFVNTIPIILLKILNPNDNANFTQTFSELENFMDKAPNIFTFNKLIIITDGNICKIGSLYEFPEEYIDIKLIKNLDEFSSTNEFMMLYNFLNKKHIIENICDYKSASEMFNENLSCFYKFKNIQTDTSQSFYKQKNIIDANNKLNIESIDSTENNDLILSKDDDIQIEKNIDFYDDLDNILSLDVMLNDESFKKEVSEYLFSSHYKYDENIEAIDKYQSDKSNKTLLSNIVINNQPLVKKIANKFLTNISGTYIDLEDLVSFGNFGLMKAIEKFDPNKGYQFSTYAVHWIGQAISRGIANESRIVRIPVHVHEKLLRLRKFERECEIKHHEIIDEVIMKNMDINSTTLNELRSIRLRFDTISSLDMPVNSDEGSESSLGDFISSKDQTNYNNSHIKDPSEMAEEIIFSNEILDFLFDNLSERELDIILRRNGFYGKPETLEEIGEIYSLTRERIRQIENKATKKLSKQLKRFLD